MDFTVRVADLTIHIVSVYNVIYEVCHEYLCDETNDINITINSVCEQLQKDYDNAMMNGCRLPGPARFEILSIHRLIAEKIICFDTILIHGAVVAVNSEAYLFCAPSGTGKTTHIKLWLKNLPDAFAVNGDKPFLRITDEKVLACGSPWCGKENLGTNTMVPLKAIIFMERGDHNEIQESTFLNVFPQLLQQTYRPESAEGMGKTLQLLKRLPGKVRFFKFKFNNFEDDAFRVAYQALCSEKS